jgi:hypothetical protein
MRPITDSRSPRCRHGSLSARLALGVMLSTTGWSATAVRAAAPTRYTVQSLLKRGDRVGATKITDQFGFEVDALNDSGQLLVVAYRGDSDTLAQLSGGKFASIVNPGEPAPTSGGKWPTVNIFSPASMNQNGNAVFAMQDGNTGTWLSTFLWNAQSGTTTVVAQQGMPAVNDLVFGQASFPRPAINNREEIAFPAEVKTAAGKGQGVGLFFRGQDRKILPVALPAQAGPDGVLLDNAFYPSLNDQGRIVFLARRYGQLRPSAYVWEQGQITPVAVVGTELPDGGKIVEVVQAWVNNNNRDVLLEVVLNDLNLGPLALYRWSNGQITPVVVPGHPMPGGGQFVTLPYTESVSFPNEAGQHAFYSLTTEGGVSRTAAYLLDTDGTLALILKSGATTELGVIARVGDPNEDVDGGGFGIAINGKGQVALILKPVNAPQNLALLTPAGP